MFVFVFHKDFEKGEDGQHHRYDTHDQFCIGEGVHKLVDVIVRRQGGVNVRILLFVLLVGAVVHDDLRWELLGLLVGFSDVLFFFHLVFDGFDLLVRHAQLGLHEFKFGLFFFCDHAIG